MGVSILPFFYILKRGVCMKKIIVMILIFIMLSTTLQKKYVKATGIGEGVLATVIATNPELAVLVGLGCLGVVCVASVYDNQNELCDMANKIKNDFIDFCSKSEKWISLKSTEIEYWLEGVSVGIIDKASNVFQAMKDYVVNLKERQDSLSESSDVPIVVPDADVLDLSETNIRDLYSRYSSDIVKHSVSALSVHSSRQYVTSMFSAIDVHSKELFHTESDNTFYVLVNFNDANHCWYALSKSFDSSDLIDTCPFVFRDNANLSSNYTFSSLFGTAGMWFRNHSGFSQEQVNSYLRNCSLYGCTTRTDLIINVDAPFVGQEWYQGIYAFLLSQYIFGELDFPKPGSKEDLANDVVIDNSIDQVIERDGTLDNVDVVNPSDVEADSVPVDLIGVTVRGIAEPFPFEDVKTVDKSTDTVLPDNTPVGDLPNDKPVSEFTITNLQTVFPFCIPWDLYKLYHTLQADAQAPKFIWKFPLYKKGEICYNELEIDLKVFDSVAQILRTVELLAFLIFLTLKTRDLIRG